MIVIALSKQQAIQQINFTGNLDRLGFPLIRNVLKSLAKSVLAPLGLTAPPADAAIHKKMFGSGRRPSDLAK